MNKNKKNLRRSEGFRETMRPHEKRGHHRYIYRGIQYSTGPFPSDGGEPLGQMSRGRDRRQRAPRAPPVATPLPLKYAGGGAVAIGRHICTLLARYLTATCADNTPLYNILNRYIVNYLIIFPRPI